MSSCFPSRSAAMKVAVACSVWLICAVFAIAEPPPDTTDVPKFDFANAAEKYVVQVRGSSKPCQAVQIDLLKWTNPLRGTAAGSVFLWTEGGVPQAACCMYAYRANGAYA